MSEEKFTQGEWEAETRILSFNDVFRFGFQVITKEKRVCFCETDDAKNIDEMSANAALIAAAPEMLEMLDEVGSDLAVAFASTPGIESKIWQDILKEDIQKICAVLKKARRKE